MRVVDRKTFLAMPAGTVFMKVPAQPKDGSFTNLAFNDVVMIKEATSGKDFIVQSLVPWFEDNNDDGEWSDTWFAMLEGKQSPPLDYDCSGRDGLYDDDQLFAVWCRDDLVRLIDRLNQALSDGYPASSPARDS